jgi:hypothetical protein
LTKDPLEDRNGCAFFKGRMAAVAPFLTTILRAVVTDFAAFVTSSTDDVVEVVECIDGKDQDERRYDVDRDNTKFSWFIV